MLENAARGFWRFVLFLFLFCFTPHALKAHNGTVVSAVYLANRLSYGDAACKTGVVMQEQMRVGDEGACFKYIQASPSYGASFRLHYAVPGFLVTTSYIDAGCVSLTASPYESLQVGVCQADMVNVGRSFLIQVTNSSTVSDVVHGYVESIYGSDATTCGAAPLLRRIYGSNRCFAQPNMADRYQYSCKKTLVMKDDVLYTTMTEINRCGELDRYLYKKYLPPPSCTQLSAASTAYPGGARSFVYFTPTRNRTNAVVSLSGYYQDISCTSPPSASYFQKFSDYLLQWYIKIGTCSLSLLGSIVVIIIIFNTPKWTDANKIIMCLSWAQLFYDLSFYSQCPQSEAVLSSPLYASTLAIGLFFCRFFSISTLLISNILSVIITYVIAYRAGLVLRRRLPIYLACVFIVAIVPTLPILLIDLGILVDSADSSIRLGCMDAFLLTQLGSIVINAAAFVYFQTRIHEINKLTCCQRGGAPEDTTSKASPLHELARRVVFYPLVQCITQGPVIWINCDRSFRRTDLTRITDDQSTQVQFRFFDYAVAVLTPLAGTLFCLVYVRFHPGAWEKFVSVMLRCGCCRPRDTSLGRVMQAELTSTKGHMSTPQSASAAAEDQWAGGHDFGSPDLAEVLGHKGALGRRCIAQDFQVMDDDELCQLGEQEWEEEEEEAAAEVPREARASNYAATLKSLYIPSPDQHLGENAMHARPFFSSSPSSSFSTRMSDAVVNPLGLSAVIPLGGSRLSAVDEPPPPPHTNKDNLPSEAYLQQTYGALQAQSSPPVLAQEPPGRLRAFTAGTGGQSPGALETAPVASPNAPLTSPPPRPPPPQPTPPPSAITMSPSPGPPSSPPPRPPPPPPPKR